MSRRLVAGTLVCAGLALSLVAQLRSGSLEVSTARGSVGPSASPPKILTAYFGYNNCTGIRDLNGNGLVDEAQAGGCRVVPVPGTQTLVTNVATPDALVATCLSTSTPKPTADQLQRLDAMPVTFSGPVQASTLDPSSFVVQMSNGTLRKPLCVALAPAIETNEGETVLIMGDFGEPKASGKPYPARLTAGGVQVMQTGGTFVTMATMAVDVMDYSASPILLGAKLTRYPDDGEASTGRGSPNHCRDRFPTTNYVLQLLWSGGVTRDGVNSLLPNENGLFRSATASGLFNVQVHNQSGALVDSFQVTGVKILGLADLGTGQPVPGQFWAHDGDNYLQICLELAAGYDPSKIALLSVDPNNSAGLKLYDPTGDVPISAQKVLITR